MDEEAFDAFYEASFGRLVGQIYAMCGNSPRPRTACRRPSSAAWDRRRTLDVDQAPEAWVRTVAYRLAVSRWRRARKSLLPPDRAHAAATAARSPTSPTWRWPAPCRRSPPTSGGRSSCTTSPTSPSPRWPPRSALPSGR